MTSNSDSHPEMHRVPFRDPSLSEELSERLLSGRAAVDDVPNAYRGLAALFETATAAPTAEEMAHKATVVAAAIAAVGGAATVHSLAPDQLRRRSMISKILTAKAAAAATVAALGLGTAAAAMAGALPTQANSHATVNLTTSGTGSTAGTNANTNNQGQGSANTPNAVTNTHAQFGLCTAFLAHHPTSTTPATSVPSDSSKVFKAFISLHGGLPGTTTYCQGVVATHSTSSATDGTDTPDTNSGTKPADAGSLNSKSTPNSGGTGTAGTASHGASSSGSGHSGGH